MSGDKCRNAHMGHLPVVRRDGQRAQRQCTLCLRGVGRVVKREEFDPAAWNALPGWERRKQPSQNSRARRYRDFLRSKEWREMRAMVLERAGGRCEGENCGAPAETVHHVRYAKVLEETPMSDLRASCVRCNVNERQQRLASGGRKHMEESANG